jgi:hypothetical protein
MKPGLRLPASPGSGLADVEDPASRYGILYLRFPPEPTVSGGPRPQKKL